MTAGTVPAAAVTSKALTIWRELNDRQRGSLEAIFGIDQGRESAREHARAQGEWDQAPASEWREIDFAHDPADQRLFGWTPLQEALASRGWHSQGNGATMAALAARGMITQSSKPTMFGQMRTVTLTKAGRAAVRAGTTLTPRRAPRPTLSERSWEVLAILWSADVAGKPLDWGSSTTIDRILIEKRDQRLAQHGRGGYTLTDAGRSYYREDYPTYTVAYPDVRAPHPDGPRAEPWPARADQILVGHHRRYHALATAWRTVHDEHETAVAETTAAATPPPAGLPDDIAEQFAARHQLRCETAAQRAGLAAAHLGDLAYRCERAAQTYATAAIDAFAATTPPSELADPAPVDADIGQPLPSLPPTGIFAIDDAAAKLHAAAAGRPRRRRGPAPKKTGLAAATRAPGTDLADLATFLRRHTDGGALRRRLHPDTSSAPTQTTDSGPR